MNADPAVLLTPAGRRLLARIAAAPAADPAALDRAAPDPAAELALATRLRREYPAALVAAAMAQRELRLAARAKFTRAAEMLLTRAGYEQASAEPVARYRAGRLAGARRIADLCCGIGGDLIALAGAGPAAGPGAGRLVLAVDRDEAHARLAVHNAAVYGAAGRVRAVVADVRDVRLAGLDAVFIDPARRSGPGTASAGAGALRLRAGLSEPPLDWCLALAGRVPAVVIKAAPGLPADLVPAGWETEFIADGRHLKEAVLWSPALATAPAAALADGPPRPRRATVLAAGPGGAAPRPHSLVAQPGAPVPLAAPGRYLLDPSPAVTRAGLVEDLARSLGGAAKIDPRIAFLTMDTPAVTPFARTLRVVDSAPWNERRFAGRLRELGVGAADIRRRGLAGDVDQMRRRLRLAGANRATIVITRVNDRPWGLICADPEAAWAAR